MIKLRVSAIDRMCLRGSLAAILALAAGLVFLVALALAPAVQAQTGGQSSSEFCAFIAGYPPGAVAPGEQAYWNANCVRKARADDDEDAPAAQSQQRPAPTPTCPNLPPSVAIFGYGPGTQCQLVGAAGVGNQEVVARGVINAVDIWGFVYGSAEVCFRDVGSFVFLDAAYTPRMAMDLASYSRAGMTCGEVNRAGTVALVPGVPSAAQDEEAPAPAISGPRRLRDCQLTTTDYVSLRGGPSVYYSRIDVIPRNSRLRAFARTSDWFMVEYEERFGWISGEWASASAGCDIIGEALEAAASVFLSPQAGAEDMAAEAPAMADEAAEGEMEDSMDIMGAPLSGCDILTGDILNLRAGPGLDYNIKAEIPNATRLVALEVAEGWFKVMYAGLSGWVSADWVQVSDGCEISDVAEAQMTESEAETAEAEAPAMTDEAAEGKMRADMDLMGAPLSGCDILTGDILNLRAGPGLEYDIQAEIPIATRLVALERAEDWFKVMYAGASGWVSADWVQASDGCQIGDEAEGQMTGSEAETAETPAMTDEAADSEMDAGTDLMGAPLSGCNLLSGDILNLRAGPGLEYEILGEVANAVSLRAARRSGDWFKVNYEGAVGWVNINYVFRQGACG